MNSKKELLAHILFSSNMVPLFKRLPMRNKLIILNYHRIRPSDPHFHTDFDDGVFNLDAVEFEREVGWLKRNTLILSEQELIHCYRGGRFSHPDTVKPCVVITFDDGYCDNYTLAFPILKHFQAPAMVFVNTQMVHSRQVSWWDVIAYLIKRCERPDIALAGQRFSMATQRAEAIAYYQNMMKQRKFEHTKYLLNELSEACDVEPPNAALQDREILTWQQIREMAQNNIAIGSHTHTHRVLSTISSNEQREEMILSKLIIEKNSGRPVHSIAYPVGETHYITAETPEIAESSGYLLGFTTNTGINDWKNIQPYKVRRTARLLEKVATVSLLTFLPELFTWDSADKMRKKTLETPPTYADEFYRRGIIQLMMGKADEAVAYLQEAVTANPWYTEARIKLGISQALAGRYDEAANHLLFILEKNASFADVHYYLGIVFSCRMEIPRAIQHMELAVNINPGYKDAILRLGVLYCHEQRYALAIKMLERALQLEPGDQELRILVETGQNIMAKHGHLSSDIKSLFTAYLGESEHTKDLIRGFIKQLAISPNLGDIMTIIEEGDFPQENIELLLELFLDYKTQYPNYSDVHYMLGLLQDKIGRDREAEACCREALRLNPTFVKAKLKLFQMLKDQNRLQEAMEQGYQLDRLNLLYPDLYCGLAETCLMLDRVPEAERFAVKALTINPAYLKAQQTITTVLKLKENGRGDPP